MIHRPLTVPLSEDRSLKEQNHILNVVRVNDYNPQQISKMIQRKQQKLDLEN